METESAEEYAAHSEVDPEAAYSEIDVEAAPGSTVIGEIRGTLRQLRRLQGIKGEGLHRRGVARSRRLQAEHERVLVERDRLAEEIGMGDDAIELREIHRAGIDIAAARGAGLPCIFAAWGYGPPAMAEGAAAIAHDFDELVTAARRLLG